MDNKVIELYNKGFGINKISNELKIKKDKVRNILQDAIAPKEVSITSCDMQNNTRENIIHNIDIEKLTVVLDNIDSIMELINNISNKKQKIILNTENTKVTSLRINVELYETVKKKAKKDNISISEIVNMSLLDYLNK